MINQDNLLSYSAIREIERADEGRRDSIITILYVVEIIVAAVFIGTIAYNVWRVWHG